MKNAISNFRGPLTTSCTESQDGFNVHMHIDGDHTEIIFVLANVIWRMHEFTGLEASEICDQLKAAVGTLDRYKDFFQRS